MADDENVENISHSKDKGFFSFLAKRWKEFRFFSPKTAESDAESSSSQEVIRLYAPQPLTDSQFESIIIRKYLELMEDNNFQKAFNMEPTEENINKLIQERNFSTPFISVVKKSLIATFKTMQNMALDEKAEVAWSMAESLACFSPEDLQYIHCKEGDSPDLKPYIRARFSDVDNMRLTLDFIGTVEEANQISSSSSSLTMKNAESIYNKLRAYEPNLDAEQKSKIYYLSSELFRRAQIIPGIYQEPKPSQKEIFCLRMVLENSSHPSLIECCLNRLSSNQQILKENIPLLISAYKRILEKQHTIFPEDAYRFNAQIAQLYLNNVNTSNSSFCGLGLKDICALHWSEYFYRQAYAKAPNSRKKFEALKAISKIQKHLGESSKSRKTAISAAKLLPLPEKYENLLDLALTDEKNTIAVVKRTIRQIKKEKMPYRIKKVLYDKALLVTRQKTKDEKVISSVEKLLPNTILTPNKKIVRSDSTYE